MNPFYVSLAPGTHTKSGALRMLPTELTLLHDLPVAQDRDRMKKHVGPPDPGPQTLAYFMDDNSFVPEEDPAGSKDYWFWVKGRAKAEVVLRAPIESLGENNWVTKEITQLTVEVRNGGVAQSRDGQDGQRIADIRHDAGRAESRCRSQCRRACRSAARCSRRVISTTLSVTTTAGFVPFLETPCEAPRQVRERRSAVPRRDDPRRPGVH